VQAHARVQSVSLEATRQRKNKEMGFEVLEVVHAEITYRSQQSDQGDRHLETNHDLSPSVLQRSVEISVAPGFSLFVEIGNPHRLTPPSKFQWPYVCPHCTEPQLTTRPQKFVFVQFASDAHVPKTLINDLAPFHI
jgi:hypothetical protein